MQSATPSSRKAPALFGLAIATVLVIKRVFRLTLRAAQSFIDSILPDERSVALPGLHQVSVSGQSRLMSVSKRPLGVKSHGD